MWIRVCLDLRRTDVSAMVLLAKKAETTGPLRIGIFSAVAQLSEADAFSRDSE